MCQRTNYHDTTNHCQYLYNGLNCFGHMVYVLQTYRFQNIAKLLIYPIFKDLFTLPNAEIKKSGKKKKEKGEK